MSFLRNPFTQTKGPPTNTTNTTKNATDNYNDVLEIAYSRVQRSLRTKKISSDTLAALIKNKLLVPWNEPYITDHAKEEAWRTERAKRCAHRRPSKYFKEKDTRYTWVVPRGYSAGKDIQRIEVERQRRKVLNKQIWECELRVLRGEVKGSYDLEGEAKKGWYEVKENIEDEDDREVFVREKLKALVDSGAELSVEWEIWNVALKLFFAEFDEEDRQKERDIQAAQDNFWKDKLASPSSIADVEVARNEICKTLFFYDISRRVADWEQDLVARIEWLSERPISEDIIEPIKWARTILEQLREYRQQEGFDHEFILKYGEDLLLGSTLVEKRSAARDLARQRNKDMW